MTRQYIDCVLVSIRFDIKMFRSVLKKQYILDSYVAPWRMYIYLCSQGKKSCSFFGLHDI